jgi:cytochrome c oxidase cbb3-type subunit III
MRRCAVHRGLTLTAFTMAVAAGCSGSGSARLPGPPRRADVAVPPESVLVFRTLYRQSCAGCHGDEGRGGAALSLNDPVYLAIVPDSVLRRVVAFGVRATSMPGFAVSAGGVLTDAQIDTVVVGMRARWARPNVLAGSAALPYTALASGDAGRGAGSYATFCASCHGADGTGGPRGHSVVDASYLALVSDQGLRTAVIVGRPELGMPDWRGYVKGRPMTDQEIRDVVAWMAARREPFPGAPYPEQR